MSKHSCGSGSRLTINALGEPKWTKDNTSAPSQTQIPQKKEVALQGINESAHILGCPS